MGMIKCKECGKDISSEALKCPHCGAPTLRDAKMTCFGWIATFAFVAAICVALYHWVM